ncbi:MAG: tail fiber domain-containing protein [Bacteroidota bacterium]|nr:tail fiber domain-containing protein [Bacteroidota bacterium]
MKTKLNLFSKSVILFLMFATSVFSQSITNTLGTSGLFLIKDAANNYLSLTQSTGQVNILKTLRLENTTSSSQGVMFKGADRFLHSFGSSNLFLGVNSGNFTLTGAGAKIGIGQSSLTSLTTGDANTALGYLTLTSNTEGYSNTALGYQSLKFNNTGYSNTAVGHLTLYGNTSGISNTAFGDLSLYSNISGNYNSALGDHALYSNIQGDDNTAVGYKSLETNEAGNKNTAVGFVSLRYNTNGVENTALGYGSLNSNLTGRSNTGVGLASLNSNTLGNYNTSVGMHSLLANIDGSFNTALGYSAGSNVTTGDNLTLVGYNAQPSSGSANNQITLGNNNVFSLRCNVQTITSLSDMRDKKNITDLNLGLDFLMKVKPRIFNWDKREWYENNISDGTMIQKIPTAGFIAQELDEVQKTENAEWLNLVLKDNPEKIEATYGNLLPVMVKAIQELKSENDILKQNNERLLSEVESLKLMNDKIAKLEQTLSEMASVKLTSFKISDVNNTILIEGEGK